MFNEITGQSIDPHQRLKRPRFSYSKVIGVNQNKSCIARGAHVFRHSGGMLVVRNWSNGRYLEEDKNVSVMVPDQCPIIDATKLIPQKAAVLLHEAGNAIIAPECYDCPLIKKCANARSANDLIDGPLKQDQVNYIETVTGMDLNGFPDPNAKPQIRRNPNVEEPGIRTQGIELADWKDGYGDGL